VLVSVGFLGHFAVPWVTLAGVFASVFGVWLS
jgi:hypothetical protein